jgi:hypothetical protein
MAMPSSGVNGPAVASSMKSPLPRTIAESGPAFGTGPDDHLGGGEVGGRIELVVADEIAVGVAGSAEHAGAGLARVGHGAGIAVVTFGVGGAARRGRGQPEGENTHQRKDEVESPSHRAPPAVL